MQWNRSPFEGKHVVHYLDREYDRFAILQKVKCGHYLEKESSIKCFDSLFGSSYSGDHLTTKEIATILETCSGFCLTSFNVCISFIHNTHLKFSSASVKRIQNP